MEISKNFFFLTTLLLLPKPMTNSAEEEGGVEGLIAAEKEIKPKQKRYKSKYSPHIFPTATTFCLKTTSITGVLINIRTREKNVVFYLGWKFGWSLCPSKKNA